MPNEILSIQHTLTQLQNVEKVQAVGQQREQYQEKQEAIHLRAERDLEQAVVQISEEAEKVFLNEEGERGRKDREERRDSKTETLDQESAAEDSRIVDIVV